MTHLLPRYPKFLGLSEVEPSSAFSFFLQSSLSQPHSLRHRSSPRTTVTAVLHVCTATRHHALSGVRFQLAAHRHIPFFSYCLTSRKFYLFPWRRDETGPI
ncbi:uncharacterized protein G2W53_025026 [Senna tora]|uniref:Uncharacterized protein n=1 Tax=Senna tora TaxID=362788 RepID=A0A834TE78_9FABA|nr:uncharacterized protein G2W53_025026 [Senna tora]